jgi:hypothetical protein
VVINSRGYPVKIKKYIYVLIALASMVLDAGIGFTVESIASVDLHEHRELYQKFIQYYCSLCPCDMLLSQDIERQFDQEEIDYQYHNPMTLFFHAKVQDVIIGYISCNIVSKNQILIRQLVFDPNMFDTVLIKELLFAIFEKFPQTKKITLQCLVTCDDLNDLLLDVGFSQIKPASIDNMYYQYELYLTSKCGICKILYGEDYWNQPFEQDQDDGYED